MAAVRALIDTVNELAQAPLRAGSRVWRVRASAAGGSARTTAAAPAATEAREMRDARYAGGNLEPPLEELLRDPMVHLVMQADRLDRREVQRVLRGGGQLGVSRGPAPD